MKLLILLLLFSSTCFSQDVSNIEKQVGDFKRTLQQNNVDTFLVYQQPCAGGVRPDTCNYFDARYLLWNQNGTTYMRKFDGCRAYQQLLLDSLNPLHYYFKHKKQIDSETIRMPTYIEAKKGNIQTEISHTVDHTCFYEMSFYIKGKRRFISVSYYDLKFEKFENGKLNIYYKYNQETKLKQLVDQLTELTK